MLKDKECFCILQIFEQLFLKFIFALYWLFPHHICKDTELLLYFQIFSEVFFMGSKSQDNPNLLNRLQWYHLLV
jgi:hypothetical protein